MDDTLHRHQLDEPFHTVKDTEFTGDVTDVKAQLLENLLTTETLSDRNATSAQLQQTVPLTTFPHYVAETLLNAGIRTQGDRNQIPGEAFQPSHLRVYLSWAMDKFAPGEDKAPRFSMGFLRACDRIGTIVEYFVSALLVIQIPVPPLRLPLASFYDPQHSHCATLRYHSRTSNGTEQVRELTAFDDSAAIELYAPACRHQLDNFIHAEADKNWGNVVQVQSQE
ncbi:MAG: hypothetical protein J3R72DRAFT_496988 [Linnemannia gamsii]|nr:MAG: hypothetical protein J3R72DRAFT_496988 [Linnemannia gamsii]